MKKKEWMNANEIYWMGGGDEDEGRQNEIQKWNFVLL